MKTHWITAGIAAGLALGLALPLAYSRDKKLDDWLKKAKTSKNTGPTELFAIIDRLVQENMSIRRRLASVQSSVTDLRTRALPAGTIALIATKNRRTPRGWKPCPRGMNQRMLYLDRRANLSGTRTGTTTHKHPVQAWSDTAQGIPDGYGHNAKGSSLHVTGKNHKHRIRAQAKPTEWTPPSIRVRCIIKVDDK